LLYVTLLFDKLLINLKEDLNMSNGPLKLNFELRANQKTNIPRFTAPLATKSGIIFHSARGTKDKPFASADGGEYANYG